MILELPPQKVPSLASHRTSAVRAFGILAAARRITPAKLGAANNIIAFATLAATALFLAASKRRRAPRKRLTLEIRVFVAGFLVSLLFILHANLVALKILPWHNVEFIGFLVFVACLRYVSAYRTFANEERLLAINKELEIARQIQSSTLPHSVPTLTGLEIAARYLPMSAVAGDFYDFLWIDEKRVGILVADVTGHGVPAALIASMLKVAFAGQAAHAHDPARVLTGLNCSLCGKFEVHFVTAAYLFVDLEKSLLHYSAAAHPTPPGLRRTTLPHRPRLSVGLFATPVRPRTRLCAFSFLDLPPAELTRSLRS